MANPFLVLGGIAISVATAAFGILQVPGWVASAQDAAAVNDLAGIRSVQAIAASSDGGYIIDPTKLSSDDATLTLSGGVEVSYFEATEDAWCAVVRSASGAHLAANDDSTDIGRGTSPGTAAASARCAGFTDPAFTPWEETRRNLAVNPRAGAHKPSSMPAFGFDADRYFYLGEHSTHNEWFRFTRTGGDDSVTHGFHLAGNPQDTVPKAGLVSVTPGDKYSLQVLARLSGGEGSSRVMFRFADGDSWVSEPIETYTTLSSAPSRVTATVTVPEGATRMAASFMSFGVPQGGYIEATQLAVEKTPTVGAFFDGSTPQGDPNLVRVRWLGEPGASPSVMETRTRR